MEIYKGIATFSGIAIGKVLYYSRGEYQIRQCLVSNIKKEISNFQEARIQAVQKLNELYEMICELPDFITDSLDEFISNYGSLEELYDHKDDMILYAGCEDMTDVAYYFIDELQALGDIPPSLQNYIDYEAYGRDLSFEGTFIETSYGMCEIPW